MVRVTKRKMFFLGYPIYVIIYLEKEIEEKKMINMMDE